MEIIHGDMWEEIGKADLLLFTTNATLNSKGELVMGAGAARQAKQRYPQLPLQFGQMMVRLDWVGKDYGVMIPGFSIRRDGFYTAIGGFQTKRHWRDEASLELIRYSCQVLLTHTPGFERVALNCPGVGLGGLSREDVEPILEAELGQSDNIYIYWR